MVKAPRPSYKKTTPQMRRALALCVTLSMALVACDNAPEDPFGAAQRALAEGEPRTAMKLIEVAVSQRPDDPRARLLAGDIAMAIGNAERAVSEFERAAQGGPEVSLAKAKLAEAQIMANYMSAAEETVASLEFDQPLAYTAAIALALSQGDSDTASGRLSEGLERFPDDPRLLTIEAERLYSLAEPDAAKKTLESALAVEPNVPQAHTLAGRMALARRDLTSASLHFTTVLKARPADQTAMLAMAAIARDRGDETQAANWINKANAAGDPHPIGLLFAAQMAYDAGDVSRAFELIEIVPPAMASEPGFARLRGYIDAARGQYGAAILPLRSYLDGANDDYAARRVLAQAYAQEGELENAWQPIAPVVRDPQAEPAALKLALELAQTIGKGDQAEIRAALAKQVGSTDMAKPLREAGEAIRAGDWAKADAIFAPLIEGETRHNAVLLNNAAAVKSQLGQHADAVVLARRALAQAPESPQILDTLGWALWREGKRLDEARGLLTRAAEGAPDNREIAEHWAIAHKGA